MPGYSIRTRPWQDGGPGQKEAARVQEVSALPVTSELTKPLPLIRWYMTVTTGAQGAAVLMRLDHRAVQMRPLGRRPCLRLNPRQFSEDEAQSSSSSQE